MADTTTVGSGLWSSEISSGTTTSAAARSTGSDLDKDAFLQLLVTQLKYQDPLDPMDNSEFVAQMAQFSALEQMQNMNASTVLSQAFNLQGKIVGGIVYDAATNTYTSVAGVVDYVSIKNGVPYLNVAGLDMSLDEVEIMQEYQLSEINSNVAISQSLGLIGQYIHSTVTDDDGVPLEYVEGKVDYIKFVNGAPILVVGSKEVSPGKVEGTSTGPILLGKEVITDLNAISEAITGVKYMSGDAYVIVNGNSIGVDNLTYLSDALRHVGETMSYGDVSGAVSTIQIAGGKIYYVVDDGTGVTSKISYEEYHNLTEEDD